MKFKEQKELVAGLRALADFYERPKSVELECPTIKVSENPAIWGTNKIVDSDGNVKSEYGIKINESLNKLKGIAKILGSCEKDYSDDYFSLVKNFGEHVQIKYFVNREAICRKVPTGETRVVPAYSQPERIEPVYEYICEDVSLLAPTN